MTYTNSVKQYRIKISLKLHLLISKLKQFNMIYNLFNKTLINLTQTCLRVRLTHLLAQKVVTILYLKFNPIE